jgi:hypothetical protein
MKTSAVMEREGTLIFYISPQEPAVFNEPQLLTMQAKFVAPV